MRKLFVVSAAFLCLGFFFTGCSEQTETDVQKMEQDVKAGEKGELVQDAETIAEDVKEDAAALEDKAKDAVEGVADKAKDAVEGAKDAAENK